MKVIYLDNNATTVISPVVAEEMAECLAAGLANPASQHRPGRQARQRLEDARDAIVRRLGGQVDRMDADRLILTSGGTEANNLAILGMAAARPGQVLVSAVEHPCVTSAAEQLQQRGREVHRLPVDASGVVNLGVLRGLLKSRETSLVSVMLANHETGVLQPIREIAVLGRESGAAVHCDAVQAIGKISVQFRQLDVDAMTISPHKFHGPIGIGGLLTRHDTQLEPLFYGGFQQMGLRPGTESAPLAVGFATALELAADDLEPSGRRMRELRDQLEQGLLARLASIAVNGGDVERLPQTSNVSFIGGDRQALLMALDMQDVACSTGSACASGSSEPSPVLQAMGLAAANIHGALRFSLSRTTTADEIELATDRILRVAESLLP